METKGIGRAQDAAIAGIQRASKLMEKAAAEVANVAMERQSADLGPAANVEISPQARAMAQQGGDPMGDIASAFVDQSVAKHLSAANVKVMQTADETLKELTKRR